MTERESCSSKDGSPSQQIDSIVESYGGWRSTTLSLLRTSIKKADPFVVEEVKWKKPSRPMGVAVWSHDGIICIGEALKSAVRLTFPKGALVQDPKNLFKTRLDSKTVRAMDVYEGDSVDAAGLRDLILGAIAVNQAKAKTR